MFSIEKMKEKRKEKKRKKQEKVAHDALNILRWCFCIFCFFSLLAYGFTLGSIIMVLLGVAAMPLQPIRDIWSRLLKDKAKPAIKVAIISIGFVLACCLLPELEDTTDSGDTQIVYDSESSELDVDTEKETESEKTETEQTVNNNDNTETENVTSESESVKDSETKNETTPSLIPTTPDVTASDIPAYSGKAYVALNNNYPSFPTDDLSPVSFEYYSELDSLGRCGVVFACVGKDIMPTEERGSIGSVKPTGWHTVKYDIVDGKYLYNRCHLIGYQLTGENANIKNLITGTRQMNIEGMLPLENMVADYVKETGNHVMYKVTPVFEGNNLLAKGVQMEAYSIEDNGAGICFNVFAYNVQDGIEINYANGDSKMIETQESEKPVVVPNPTPTPTPEPDSGSNSDSDASSDSSTTKGHYAVNNKNGKIHKIGECSATGTGSNAMTDVSYFDTYEEALAHSKKIAPNLDKRDCGNCW